MAVDLGYRPALDGVRAVAILLVVTFHATAWPFGGPYGVDLFFVLSGFLITTLLLEERERDGSISLRAFYARRARRLLPAVTAMLAAYLLYGAIRGENLLGDVAGYGLYVGNIYYVIQHYHDQTGLGHLWSLAEEEQFYVLWPAALILITRARRPMRWVLALLAAAAAYRVGMIAHGAPMDRMYRAPDTHAEPLFVGAALAFVRRAGYVGREWHGKLGVSLLGPCVILGNWKLLLPAIEVGAACIVLAAVSDTELARILSARWLVWLGKRSYSLYVWHFPILWAFGRYGSPFCVAAALIVAPLSYWYVEQPFRRRRAATAEPAPVQVPAAA
jgi:peptidoglycan/LPS O-acetylase OafA/YrhL